MDRSKLIIIGNENDILHCGYSHALSDGGKRYPSADHYAYSMILTQLGLDEALILELLCTSSSEVPIKARQLLEDNMPSGHDMNSLSSYLQTSRQSYTMQGLRLRVEQDPAFERALVDTKDALLVVCDARDSELGIGMDEDTFVEWMAQEDISTDLLGEWMRNERTRPPNLGHNQLGYFLMWLRYEVAEKKRSPLLCIQPIEVSGISLDQSGEPLRITASELVISLEGIFRPLSNYFAMLFEMKGERYRSVEHYAYQRLLEALRFDDKIIEKVRTTVDPRDVAMVVLRIFKEQKVNTNAISTKLSRLDRWRQSAMKHKMTKNETLQHLLLATGHAILIDCTEGGDASWVSSMDEYEMQHLLTKQYITPTMIIDWMAERSKPSMALSHIKGNKTGLLLMELRTKFALSANSQNRVPLISTLNSAPKLRTLLSAHLICFTVESVFHFLYPAEIRISNTEESFRSPAHYVASSTIKYFNICKENADWIVEAKSSVECWYRLHTIIESGSFPVEKIQGWYMDERQRSLKMALAIMLEQHPPLMRALLDTGDAFLACCSRFSSLESELTIGMRERDLRGWLSHLDIDTKQLLDSVLRPLAFRPPYLGGNRLGCILMELRREFVLRGICPHQLPALQFDCEIILGSDSPSENFVSNVPFFALDHHNFETLWANPYILLSKQKKDPEWWTFANSRKVMPKLVSVDERRLNEILIEIDAYEKFKEKDIEMLSLEEMRALFLRLAIRMQNRLNETDAQQNEMNLLAKEIAQMRSIKRSLEERKSHMDVGGQIGLDRRDKRDTPIQRRQSPSISQVQPHSHSSVAPAPLNARSYSPPPQRKWEDRRRVINKRYSPLDERPKRRSPLQLKTYPITPPKNSRTPSPIFSRARIDDAELSEGEILSD